MASKSENTISKGHQTTFDPRLNTGVVDRFDKFVIIQMIIAQAPITQDAESDIMYLIKHIEREKVKTTFHKSSFENWMVESGWKS